jgi:hypothetical protein
MEAINQQMLTGERSLFKSQDLIIKDSVFADGESPLKESSDISIENSIFKWKYPLWYSKNINVKNSSFLEMARSGIWYTHHISISDSIIEAPKTFRRASDIHLTNVDITKCTRVLLEL